MRRPSSGEASLRAASTTRVSFMMLAVSARVMGTWRREAGASLRAKLW